MNRRRFLGAVGGASGSSLAGCPGLELADGGAPPDDPERVHALERERALLLYAGGVALATEGESANGSATLATRADAGPTTECLYYGRASGYYDGAAWNFARAAGVLATLDDALDPAVEATREAGAKAYHLGLGNAFRARAVVEAAGDQPVEPGPPSTATDGAGLAPTADDPTPVAGDSPAERADAHLALADERDALPVAEFRELLDLAGG